MRLVFGDVTMNDVFSKLNGGELLGLFGIGLGLFAVMGGIAIAISTVVTYHRRRMELDEMEATMKMEMIQRGMSAQDIKTVLEAKLSATKGRSLRELFGSSPAPWQMPSPFGTEPKKG